MPMVNAVRDAGAAAPLRRALAAAALLGLGGCSWLPAAPSMPYLSDIFSTPSQVRGNMVSPEELSQVVVGVSTRDDVQAALGSPTTTATFDDSDWYYIGAVTRQQPARTFRVEDQQVVVVSFNAGGTVREVRRLGAQDGRTINVVARTTPSPGNERSVLQQLFGNIGRVGPGLGQQGQGQGPGGAGPAPTGQR